MLYRRVALSVLLIVSVGLLATPIQVNAQLGPYVWFWADSSVSACSDQGFTIPLIITYTVSAQGASYREVDSLNGQVVYRTIGATDFKGSSINTPSLGYKTTKIRTGGFPTKEPYTYVTDYTFSGYGRVILTLMCNGGPTVGVTNNATLLDDNSRPVATQYFVDFSYLGGATSLLTGCQTKEPDSMKQIA